MCVEILRRRLLPTAQEARLNARIRNKCPGKRNKGKVKGGIYPLGNYEADTKNNKGLMLRKIFLGYSTKETEPTGPRSAVAINLQYADGHFALDSFIFVFVLLCIVQ